MFTVNVISALSGDEIFQTSKVPNMYFVREEDTGGNNFTEKYPDNQAEFLRILGLCRTEEAGKTLR